MSVQLGRFQPDDIVTGKIIEIEPTGVLVDFNTEELVHVPLLELSLNDIHSPEDALQLNEIREFLVLGNYDGKSQLFCANSSPEMLMDDDRLYDLACNESARLYGRAVDRENIIPYPTFFGMRENGVSVILQWFIRSDDRPPTVSFSIRHLELKKAWERVRQLQAEDAIVSATIFQKTPKNGLVKIEGLCGSIQTYVDQHREELVEGKELPLKIIEVCEASNRLILLHYPVWCRLRELHVGQIISGMVRSIKDYGVWVDIGDFYGMLPASSIVNLSVAHPSQVFNVNDRLEARVVEIDIKRGTRVILEALENLE
jgi:ribosomal protein S1